MEKGNKIPLRKATSKYNIDFIYKLNSASTNFCSIITAEHIAIKLLRMNSEYDKGEEANLWNLIKAQSGTIRYNRILKSALKTYIIDRQSVYNSIKQAIAKQEDRVTRNSNLVMDLLKDYGLDNLIEIVEKENNMSFLEHIREYTDKIGKTLIFGINNTDENEIKEYYSSIEDAYIDYLKEVASRNNLSLDNTISDRIKVSRQFREKIKDDIKQSKQIEKDLKTSEIIKEALTEDNLKLNRELNSDRFHPPKKLDMHTVETLYKKLEELGTTVYYIAACKYEKVYYVSINRNLTESITRILFFATKEGAESYKEYVTDLFKNTTLQVCSITLNAAVLRKNNMRDAFEMLKEKTPLIVYNKELSEDLSKLVPSNAYSVASILKEINGINLTNSIADVSIFSATTLKDGVRTKKYVTVDSDGVVRLFDDIEYTYSKLNNINYNREYIQKKLSDIYIITEEKIHIDSKWYQSKIRESDMRHNQLLKKLFGDKQGLDEIHLKHINETLSKLSEYKLNGYNQVYYIIILDVTGRCESVFYTDMYKRAIRTNNCQSITFFESEDAAYKEALEINKYKNSYLAFVKTIQL